jgi:hypothetical protein
VPNPETSFGERNGDMGEERTLTVDLGGGDQIAVVAEMLGGAELVADRDVVASLGTVTGSIEKVGSGVLEAVKRTGSQRVAVELGFGLAIEAGHLIALFGKGKGEASIKVTLEWSRSEETG